MKIAKNYNKLFACALLVSSTYSQTYFGWKDGDFLYTAWLTYTFPTNLPLYTKVVNLSSPFVSKQPFLGVKHTVGFPFSNI